MCICACACMHCVIPIILYGCDTWLLNSTTLLLLYQFQNEIGRRILKLQKNASGKVTRLCLNFKSMACRILLRKLSFLGKLLESRQRTISSAIFTSATISDPSEVSIVQQCKMLESRLSVQIVDDCLSHSDAAPAIVRSEKSTIIDADMGSLIISALHHPSACHIATIATKISWNHLWNLALDRGTNGTSQLQRIVHHLSRPTYPGRQNGGGAQNDCQQYHRPTTAYRHHIRSQCPIRKCPRHLVKETSTKTTSQGRDNG